MIVWKCVAFILACMGLAAAEEGILMAGGTALDASVEVFFPLTNESCFLPPLPGPRWGHTVNGVLVCGGAYPDIEHIKPLEIKNCLALQSGQWVESGELREERNSHTSWTSKAGLMLMGGWGSPGTTEVWQGGPSFPLQYSSIYSCSIQDLTSPTVIITGGVDEEMTATNLKKVTRYDIEGFVEDLPPLNIGRAVHGCGAYLRDTDGSQVLLVAGGSDETGEYMSSTEVLTTSSSSWAISTPLPRVLAAPGVALAMGRLYLLGGEISDENPTDEILTWVDKEGVGEWLEVAKMKVPRTGDAATILRDHPEMEYCTFT